MTQIAPPPIDAAPRIDEPLRIDAPAVVAAPVIVAQGHASHQTPAERALARLIVESLQLEVQADAIVPQAALFGDGVDGTGLGLDSIDALELALAISRAHGFELRSDDEGNQRIFASLRSLSAHVEANRTT